MSELISGNSYIGKIFQKEFQGKTEVTSKELYNLDANADGDLDLDADGNGEITSKELKTYIKAAGIDAKFSNADLAQLEKDAKTLTALIKQGGTLVKHETEANSVTFGVNFSPKEPAPTIAKLKDPLNVGLTFKMGQSGPDVNKIHNLLNNINSTNPDFVFFKPNNDKFDERTAKIISDFQKSTTPPLIGQEGVVEGQIDIKTLLALQQRAEIEIKDTNVYQFVDDGSNRKPKPITNVPIPTPRPTDITTKPTTTQPTSPTTPSTNGTATNPTAPATTQPTTETTTTPATTEAKPADNVPKLEGITPEKQAAIDKVREKIVNQLKDKGLTDDQISEAFKISKAMLDTGVDTIKESETKTKYRSSGLCYTGVKESMERELNIKYPYLDPNARNADNQIFSQKTGKYKELFSEIKLTRADLQNLPPELALIGVHEGGKHGHIGIKGYVPGPSGKMTLSDVSDKIRPTVNQYADSAVSYYLPIGRLPESHPDYISKSSAEKANNLAIGVKGGGGARTKLR